MPVVFSLQVDNNFFLELVYKTNKAFDFKIGLNYSKDSELINIYSINSPKTEILIQAKAQETDDWLTASYDITPLMTEVFIKMNIAINYLEKLNENYRIKEQDFVWDANLISIDSASQIGANLKTKFGIPTIRLLSYNNELIEMSSNLPILQKNIVIITRTGTREKGTISITF